MDLRAIDEQVGNIAADSGDELIYELLTAYGFPKASITRLRNGSYNQSDEDGVVLWKGKVYCRYAPAAEDDIHLLIDEARSDEEIEKQRPRFLIVHDDESRSLVLQS